MSKEGDKCHCSWPECGWFSEQIEMYAPKGHVWKGNRHRWKEIRLSERTMFERMLFLAAMCQHVPGIEEAFQDGGRGGNRKEIVLARHHFPIVVYEFLGTRRITTLVKEGQMDFLAERDGFTRLLDEWNRVRELVTLLKHKILPPGRLRDSFLARENEFVGSKGKLYICAPVTTCEEVIHILNTFQSNEKECISPVASKQVVPTSQVDASPLMLLGMAAELPDAILTKQQSLIPSVEECVANIKSKVKTLGIQNARVCPNFMTSIRLLRFFYSNHTAIPLNDGKTFDGYLYPCKNDDDDDCSNQNKYCETFQIANTISGQGLYCIACQSRSYQTSSNHKFVQKRDNHCL